VGQKVHPIGFRLGVFEDWSARWYAKGSYGKQLLEDLHIRKFLKQQLNDIDIAKVVIEKAGDSIRVIISSSRPGFIIGKKGAGIERLKAEFFDKFRKNVDVSVQEVRVPDLDANLVAKNIADQLARRVSFKRAMKRAGYATMKSGAKGIKICCAGRLNGAEIARSEWLRLGSVPLHTLRSKIGFAAVEAQTTYGLIGIKVWICNGEY